LAKLNGKISLITGAASGLGKAAAFRFAEEGSDIAVADVDIDGGKVVASEIRNGGRRALAFSVDVTSSAEVQRTVNACIEEFGRIDVLLHCAGIARWKHQWAGTQWLPMEKLQEEDWDKIVEINLKGRFLVDQKVGTQMIKQRRGSIINVASLSGVVANKGLLGHGAYCASKAGVISLTRVLATEWAPYGIRVNSISPGYMDTGMLERTKSIRGLYQLQLEMTPLGRYGKPEEFARTSLFLASEDASYITGHNLMMDSGYTAL
jgi:NAD(P)-dependent dehydrogenase (short-subunit alcohol dehydrogenase family)